MTISSLPIVRDAPPGRRTLSDPPAGFGRHTPSITTQVLQCSTLRTIGIRELRQQASEYLRHVEAGRTVEITARGRPVALLVPVRGAGHVERLVRRGRVMPPTGDLLDLGPPLMPAAGRRRPSAVLARARARER